MGRGDGEQTDLALELPGDVSAEWCPDGTGLLVVHGFEARGQLFRYDLGERRLVEIPTPRGAVSGATARPDGSVEYLWSSAAEPPAVRSTTGGVVLDPPGMKSPGSVPVEDVWVEGPGGRIHALVQKPAGVTGPLPTVFDIHGGPTWHDSDSFAAGPAAWVDHGYAVVRVNYRGSTGYGRAWTDALKHRVGLIELEDIAAVREWAIGSGLADPARLILTGGSWGGYLTLLGIGTQPDAWALGIAAVPVADYVTAYHDEMEALKAMDRTLLGGTPEQVPDRFEASSPITYVDEVKAPVYISAGSTTRAVPSSRSRTTSSVWSRATRCTRSTATRRATAPWWSTNASSRCVWSSTSRRGTSRRAAPPSAAAWRWVMRPGGPWQRVRRGGAGVGEVGPAGQQERGGEQEDAGDGDRGQGPARVARTPQTTMRPAWTSLPLTLQVLSTRAVRSTGCGAGVPWRRPG
ncbi:hypothetical protein SHKM778_02790 [Streptomyces sp. KM77-8]|uniref:Peptidase S9 prolyl oligopeptidase catalytic domain-containing protein n=1 Tax=Streptomyces haneummycinicus TaxID=3074435 RepID=A0AAT9H947_9ACTN